MHNEDYDLPIEVHIVGRFANAFHAQKEIEGTLYILPRGAFVARASTILADSKGDADAWIPWPQEAPEHLCGGCTAVIIRLSDDEEDRCYVHGKNCKECRNHECTAYEGSQGRGTPSWHTLSPHGRVARAWTSQSAWENSTGSLDKIH